MTAADLSAWREAFLAGGAASLKSRPRDDRDARIAQLQAKLGEVTMDCEFLQEKEDRSHGRRSPFGGAEVEAMSTVLSTSANRRYGLARVCRVWGIARAGIFRGRRAVNLPTPPRRRPGPQGPMPDAALLDEIRTVLADSPFHGEG